MKINLLYLTLLTSTKLSIFIFTFLVVHKPSIITRSFFEAKLLTSSIQLILWRVTIILEHHFLMTLDPVLKKDTSSMIKIDAFVDEEFLNTYWADGLVVSTP